MHARSPAPSATALNGLRQVFPTASGQGQFNWQELRMVLEAANALAALPLNVTN